jgi:hypothetical protein
MTDIAALPNPLQPSQVLGNLLGLDQTTARTIQLSAPAQARPAGLAVIAATDLAGVQLAVGYRRPSSPFAF